MNRTNAPSWEAELECKAAEAQSAALARKLTDGILAANSQAGKVEKARSWALEQMGQVNADLVRDARRTRAHCFRLAWLAAALFLAAVWGWSR